MLRTHFFQYISLENVLKFLKFFLRLHQLQRGGQWPEALCFLTVRAFVRACLDFECKYLWKG